MLKKMNKTTKNNLITYAMVILAFVIMQILISAGSISSLLQGLMVPLCTYIILAVSLNLVVGILGELSLGHAGFMCVGAFTSAFFSKCTRDVIASDGLRFFLALLIGIVTAAIFGMLIGIPVLRLKSDYLAIATLGFSEIIRAVIAAPQLDQITNGSYGLKSIPGFPNLFMAFGLCALCILLMVLLINSSYGRVFKALREDEIAAQAMGLNLFRYKELAFVISSFFTGVGGGLLAMFMRSIDSKTFSISLTYDILLIVVLGGIGSVTGSVLGSFLVTAGREWLRFFDNPLTIAGIQIPLFRTGFRMVIFSILLMVVVLFYSRGLMGSNEFSWDGLGRLLKGIPSRLKGSKKSKKGAKA